MFPTLNDMINNEFTIELSNRIAMFTYDEKM